MNKLSCLLLFVVLFVSCTTLSSYDNYDVVYRPKYATRFELRQLKDTLMLITKNPWSKDSNDFRCYKFHTSHSKVVCMSSTHVAMMDRLGLEDVVIGVSGGGYLYSDKHHDKQEVGYNNNLSYERVVALDPDVMSVYEIMGESSSQNIKLNDMGVPTVYIADYLEDNPLGRAEWIVVFGALCGEYELAKSVFDSIEIRYNNIKQSALSNKIKVMLNSPYRDVWYLPSQNSYIVELIDDAGGVYLGEGLSRNATAPVGIETAYSLLLQADVWLNTSSQLTTKEALFKQNHRLKGIDAKIFSNIKRINSRGGNDFFEGGILNPDIILQDLIDIFEQVEIVEQKKNLSKDKKSIVKDGGRELFYYKEIK